ncbi:MAG: TPM domain-containing protein [Acidobacteriota bacterium]|nr:TPM domain-containing protein [Acidobacteriota bacterium]
MLRHGIAALALVILAGAAFAPAGPVTPALAKTTKYLDDRAGVFEQSRERALNEKLAAFERATSDQVVVVVERRLPEEISIEELANRTFRDWKIGQKGGSNGVLFLVFIDDRKMRLEVGYGLEGAIPDARAPDHRRGRQAAFPQGRLRGWHRGGRERDPRRGAGGAVPRERPDRRRIEGPVEMARFASERSEHAARDSLSRAAPACRAGARAVEEVAPGAAGRELIRRGIAGILV